MCPESGTGMQSKSLFERQVENRTQQAEIRLPVSDLTALPGTIGITVRATLLYPARAVASGGLRAWPFERGVYAWSRPVANREGSYGS